MERRGAVEVPVAEVVEEAHLSEPRRSSPWVVFAAAAGDENDAATAATTRRSIVSSSRTDRTSLH
jgi:hypothetical protein